MILILDSIIEHYGDPQIIDFAEKLHMWVQKGFEELGDFGGSGCGQNTHNVVTSKMFKDDPHKAAEQVWERSGKKSAANGAVMRTSILGIPHFDSLDIVSKNTKNIAKVTHADDRCIASSVAVTVAIALILQGKFDLESKAGIKGLCKATLTQVYKEIADSGKDELKHFVSHATLYDLFLDEEKKIGYTFKSMGSGFWALRTGTNFKDSLTALVMEAGDADTNGAVAGALLGAKLGYSRLPKDWLEGMPHHDWLVKKMVKLLDLLVLPRPML